MLNDDDVETGGSEEAMISQSESFESGDDSGSRSESEGDVESGFGAESGDDSGSGSASESDSGADGDSALEFSPPKKRTKRVSRA